MTQYDPSARAIVAHFFVGKAEKSNATTQVGMGAVCRGVANAMWSQYTPSGSIQMNVLNDAIDFQVGDEYEVTFRKIVKPSPNDGHPIEATADKRGLYICETCGMSLGHYTEEAQAKEPWTAQYSTEETKAKALALHEEAFGKKEL